VSAARDATAGESEELCWAAMLDIYGSAKKGPIDRATMDGYLAPEVTVWDHTQPPLFFGPAGLDRMRANRAPGEAVPSEILPLEKVVGRYGDVVICRQLLDVRFSAGDDQAVRATVVWAAIGDRWQEVHSHHDLHPHAAWRQVAADPIPADAVPEGPCADRLSDQKQIYAYALAGDPVSLDAFLSEEISVWDAWQLPMFFGYGGLTEMRSHREPDAERVTELVVEDPVYSQYGEIVIARHVLVCRYVRQADERMRCTIVWQRFGEDWKIVHSHEDLLPQNPDQEATDA
jgi:hypothetical protein